MTRGSGGLVPLVGHVMLPFAWLVNIVVNVAVTLILHVWFAASHQIRFSSQLVFPTTQIIVHGLVSGDICVQIILVTLV